MGLINDLLIDFKLEKVMLHWPLPPPPKYILIILWFSGSDDQFHIRRMQIVSELTWEEDSMDIFHSPLQADFQKRAKIVFKSNKPNQSYVQ